MWEGACSHILTALLQGNRATCGGACSHILTAFLQGNQATCGGACSHILTAFLQGNRATCGRGLAPDSNLPVTLLSSGGERH
ncbi:hypothetical protein F0170_13510 [Pseudomonas sp. MAFF 730085]|uniref:SWIM-type domain-containing protein n=1 Tax=Pseudomonas kitaguniensis TaxID=2607908 RepID=A0A5N7JU20_9PSED|nr:hypothetical protein [Pseudomonas kitaguniensis]